MDKIFSARIDEVILKRIGSLARRLNTTKKAIIEQAILQYAEKVEAAEQFDVLAHTLGAWKRQESPDKTVGTARKAFGDAMERHQK